MPYDTIRNGLTNILSLQGFAESSETGDFENAPASEYGNTFILTCNDGEADEANEQQSAFLYDNQVWDVKIAFDISSQSGFEQLNAIHRKRDILLAELDDPGNWRSFCTLLRYRSWAVEQKDSYYVLTIQLKVKDLLTY